MHPHVAHLTGDNSANGSVTLQGFVSPSVVASNLGLDQWVQQAAGGAGGNYEIQYVQTYEVISSEIVMQQQSYLQLSFKITTSVVGLCPQNCVVCDHKSQATCIIHYIHVQYVELLE